MITGITAGGADITYTTAPNGNGCTNATTASIVINPLPVGVITGTAAVNMGNPASPVIFTGNGTTPFTFTYNINGDEDKTVSTVSGNSVSVSQPTSTPETFKYIF